MPDEERSPPQPFKHVARDALHHGIAAAQAVPVEEIGWFNPWLDIAAARHEIADARMFIS